MTELQNASLNKANGDIQFHKNLNAERATVFGIKYKKREEEPPMSQIMTWGYEAPVKNDYAKDNAEISNKIRKTGSTFLSEAHDNFRAPSNKEKENLLFNYFDFEEMEMFKKKFLAMKQDKENFSNNVTTYRKNFNDAATPLERLQQTEHHTAAGKASLDNK